MNHLWKDSLILDPRVRFSSVLNLPQLWTLTSQFTGGSAIAYYALLCFRRCLLISILITGHSFVFRVMSTDMHYH